MFYGDNTEFRNPFREGETIFGAALRAAVAVAFNERTQLTLGFFGNRRFGSENAFDLARPIIALRIGTDDNAFTFGTLSAPQPGVPPGPDRTGPHRLLPPLQRETLAFERPYEAGFEWTFTRGRLHHHAWIDWRRLNTPEQRERFDTGMNGALKIDSRTSVPFQLFIVHEGGQQFDAGPVNDSLAAAAGIKVEGPLAHAVQTSLEVYGLAARDIPDREQSARTLDGGGFFGRAAAQFSGWRGHLLFWRGKLVVTREGDPNYLSLRRDGSIYRGTRDYAEAGVTRTFRPAAGVLLEASGRLHRVEKHYEYSYRIVATANAKWLVWRRAAQPPVGRRAAADPRPSR